MLHQENDPSLKTYLLQIALDRLGYAPGEPDNIFGPKTQSAYQEFLKSKDAPIGEIISDRISGDGTWSFTLGISGDDLWANDIVITAFGGSSDPQDSGDTASGISTKLDPTVQGVSLPMDGRSYHGLSPAEHRALDGSPFPKMPWGTLVEVKIGNKVLVPAKGIIDLGPGKQASKPGEPHACDLTVAAARFFDPHASATNFYARGDVRVIGGAKYL